LDRILRDDVFTRLEALEEIYNEKFLTRIEILGVKKSLYDICKFLEKELTVDEV